MHSADSIKYVVQANLDLSGKFSTTQVQDLRFRLATLEVSKNTNPLSSGHI